MESATTTVFDWAPYIREEPDGAASLSFLVDGVTCGGCVARIESALAKEPGVVKARVNLTAKRLGLTWRPGETDPVTLAEKVTALGYRLVPFDPAALDSGDDQRQRFLLRALAVAGFAAANVMLLSVAVWAGYGQEMGPVTRDLLHWVSALIALPAIAYSGRPFFYSAAGVLRHGAINMDVPISLAVLLAAMMSLFQTASGAEHVYFDSAVALLFFLLVGRYLDCRARGRVRSAAHHMLAMKAVAVTVVTDDGASRIVPPESVTPGMTVLVVAGEQVPVDGVVSDGASDVDTGLISGETVPAAIGEGDRVFAGTLNLTGALRLRVTAVGEGTLLAEIARLVELAEQGRARYVVIADRAARIYAPLVHTLALLTFMGWMAFSEVGWQAALLNAIAVLIITCPCALGLAVPVVQVLACGRLLRNGILLKSATALERLAEAGHVVFDKTGTLTGGCPELLHEGEWTEAELAAAALATASRHPLARALCRAAPEVVAAMGVKEIPGCGLEAGAVRLGSRAFTGVADDGTTNDGTAGQGPELWLSRPGVAPVCFAFSDSLREDAVQVVAALKARGLSVSLLSGDRKAAVAAVAEKLGIADWKAECTPAEKLDRLQELKNQGHRVMMVGDGLNDAPALAGAFVSLSPADAPDISQTSADAVFQGSRLAPVVEILDVARRSAQLVKQNFALAFLYNAVTIPLAVAGLVTPLLAAVAMSLSSLAVMGNSLRLAARRGAAGIS
ncbi:MAG: cadmium-translocating P-type ATPase [Alphaproteobacteria bacterium]|nr:cadmium-translocating P-type ATPase [Alphaproteobacteria bacterium]